MKQSDLYGLTAAFVSGLFTSPNGAATLTSTVTIQGCIEGVFFPAVTALTAAAMAPVSNVDGTTVVTATTVSVGDACIFVHCANAAGAVKTIQGPIGAVDGSGVLIGALAFPEVPANLCPLAYTEVKCGPTGTGFIPGTTNWNATGVVAVTKNLATLPRRPLTT